MPIENTVAHEEEQHRFVMHSEAGLAQLQYRRNKSAVIFVHTEVPDEVQGRGIASQLAKAGLDFARSQNLRVVPKCPFVADYIERHAEYRDLVS